MKSVVSLTLLARVSLQVPCFRCSPASDGLWPPRGQCRPRALVPPGDKCCASLGLVFKAPGRRPARSRHTRPGATLSFPSPLPLPLRPGREVTLLRWMVQALAAFAETLLSAAAGLRVAPNANLTHKANGTETGAWGGHGSQDWGRPLCPARSQCSIWVPQAGGPRAGGRG